MVDGRRPESTGLTVRPRGPRLAGASAVRGRVMWAKAISSWGRLLGLGQADKTREEERRIGGRTPCDVETTIQSANGDAGPSLPARARNVSRGGINLSAGRKFTPGRC